ncbi:hypothetical protein VP14_107 [Vibrio phage VPMCC14]|nr:hypothetical protein VP14_107 [Vibrio phage VPMCC14]
MKEVILKYDEVTGEIQDMDGMILTIWSNLNYKDVPEVLEFAPDPLDKITKLKSMMSVEEILSLKDAGLL